MIQACGEDPESEDPESIEAMVRRAQQDGDRESLARLFDIHSHRVMAVIQVRLNPRLQGDTSVEDIFQDASVVVLEKIRSFRWQGPDSFFRWYCGIAVNQIRNLARQHSKQPRRNRRPLEELENFSSILTTASSEIRKDENLARLKQALYQLSESHREVLIMNYLEQLEREEIARILKRSTNAVQKLLGRAREKLSRILGESDSNSMSDRFPGPEDPPPEFG